MTCYRSVLCYPQISQWFCDYKEWGGGGGLKSWSDKKKQEARIRNEFHYQDTRNVLPIREEHVTRKGSVFLEGNLCVLKQIDMIAKKYE